VTVQVPYCGTAPLPGALLGRFNLDPVLIAALVLFCACQWWVIQRRAVGARQHQMFALGGWLVAAGAFLSPLCALSVALFSARIAQHMILILVAAPMIAMGLPPGRTNERSWRLWVSATAVFFALWYWHMPIPYDATFTSVPIYWCMHITLFGSSIFLWRSLLDHPSHWTGQVLTAGSLTFLHMGLLGAILTFAARPLFLWHLTTTQVWGLTPLQDQQLGGSLMWVPGIAFFLWSTLLSLSRLWRSLERARPA
jgi:putative membrane protein